MKSFVNSINSVISLVTHKPDYFHIPHTITSNLNISYPLDYYINLRPKIDYNGKFDDNNVILIDYGKNVGWNYYPITIFNYGLAAFQNYFDSKNKIYFDKMANQLNWACSKQIKEGKHCGAWIFPCENATFNLAPGWISAMAQGLGISLLLRAWNLTQKQDYLDAAELAFIPFTRTVQAGGVLARFQDKYNFWEEYPANPPVFVLNGYITALLGLRDLAVFRGSDQANKMWNEGIDNLKQMLPFYDTGFWSRYDLRAGSVNIASGFYHKYHITLLSLLYQITNEQIFKTFANKFSVYENSTLCKGRAFVHKVIWRCKKLV